jgi:Arc/MetJ-type ribon-helix-helix transcriptional regulator
VFDKARQREKEAIAPRAAPEEERIALRCSRRELQLVDSFVASGEFDSRSELIRQALRSFLQKRASAAVPAPAADPRGLLEASVRLRPDEIETIQAYGELAGNGQPLADLLATLVRRGELELKVAETVARSRASVREAEASRARLRALGESGDALERRGVVGR